MSTVLKNVMLIDDDYATNYLHQLFLEESGRVENIMVAKSADEALTTLKEGLENNQIPEVIFLDINLPAKNGWEFIDEYSEIVGEASKNSKVIMLSTSENPRDMEKSKEYNLIKEYRIKPLSVDIINEVVNKYFQSLIIATTLAGAAEPPTILSGKHATLNPI